MTRKKTAWIVRLLSGLVSTFFLMFATASHAAGTVVGSHGVLWLADANLPATMPMGLACAGATTTNCINSNGSMNYSTALGWISALRSANYLGRNNWQLPATQSLTAGCGSTGKHGESFGYGCTGSALATLYKQAGLTAPVSGVGPFTGAFHQFTNLQPNYYWTNSPAGAMGSSGFHTFSFATGFSGANQGTNKPGKSPDSNFFFVLPEIVGNSGTAGTVYDAKSNTTWLADGNIALTHHFGLALCSGLGSATSVPCVNADGTMTQKSAQAFVIAMDTVVINHVTGYLGETHWVLPTTTAPNGCQYAACAANPLQSPLASLFYNELHLSAGDSVANPFVDTLGAFSNVQPYLYWSCQGANSHGPAILSACSSVPQCDPSTMPNPCGSAMEWSFNMGDGFQGTDEETNDLFVTAYSAPSVPEPDQWLLLMIGIGFAGAGLRWRGAGVAPI